MSNYFRSLKIKGMLGDIRYKSSVFPTLFRKIWILIYAQIIAENIHYSISTLIYLAKKINNFVNFQIYIVLTV